MVQCVVVWGRRVVISGAVCCSVREEGCHKWCSVL